MFKLACIALSTLFVGTAFASIQAPEASLIEAIAPVTIVGELPVEQPTIIRLHDTVVAVKRAHVRSQRWSCGEYQANMLGGSQKSCEWK